MKSIIKPLLKIAFFSPQFFLFSGISLAQSPRDYGFQVGYGYSVGTSIMKGDTMFLGGDFDYVGLYSGSLVSVDLGTAAIKTGFPVVNGTIRAMIDDGAGGYYIGGDFSEVNGYKRIGLAHITSARTLDLAWNINVDFGSGVYALLLSLTKDTLWVGGTFNSIGGVSKDKLAAIKVSTKSVISGWGPGLVNKNWWAPAVVSALAYYPADMSLAGDAPRLIIGGDFSGFNWTDTKSSLAALDPKTGTLIKGWKADITPTNSTTTFIPVGPAVRSLMVDEMDHRFLYIGGLFDGITDKNGTVNIHSLAKMDVLFDSLAKLFSPDLKPQNDSGIVDCIKLLKDGPFYELGVAGKFRSVGTYQVQNFTYLSKDFGTPIHYGSNWSNYLNASVVDTTLIPGQYAMGEIFTFDTIGTNIILGGDFEGIKGSANTVNVRR
ncbi:MAG TPA: hypothetical protein VFQ58_02685, partial [Flavisolibacter sp.]|nr:hypothetical protein [Flavisolibacter sp.]